MKQIMESFGWYMWHQCTCGGTLKQKFKHPGKPGQEFRCQPNKNLWFYFVNKVQNDKGNLSNLATKLSTL